MAIVLIKVLRMTKTYCLRSKLAWVEYIEQLHCNDLITCCVFVTFIHTGNIYKRVSFFFMESLQISPVGVNKIKHRTLVFRMQISARQTSNYFYLNEER